MRLQVALGPDAIIPAIHPGRPCPIMARLCASGAWQSTYPSLAPSKHRPDLEEIPKLGDAPFAAWGVTFGCYSHVGVERLPGLRLEMANTKRDQDKRTSWTVVMRPSLCPSFGGAHTAVGSRGLCVWVSHKLLLAGLHPNRFLLAPPWKLGVVTLCGGPKSLGSSRWVFYLQKGRISKWRDPDSKRGHHGFQIGPETFS
jgi:hypothetical protein